MKPVRIKSLGLQTSRLGFGCASLGSRLDRARGLKALDRAFEHGVLWYDVAPSYGDGAAEEILAQFLRSRRGRVQVCTKVGFRAAPPNRAMRLARPWLRAAVAAVPQLRPLMRRRRSANRVGLTGETIDSSLAASLRKLQLERVEVLALHEPCPEDLNRDDVRRILEDLVASGRVGGVALAVAPGDDVSILSQIDAIGLLQAPVNAFDRSILDQFGRLPPRLDIITHSAFGAARAIPQLAQLLGARSDFRKTAADLGYDGPILAAAAEMLADYALAANPDGPVLMSMFRPDHLRFNLDRAGRPARPDVIALLDAQTPAAGGEDR
jgi:aryl-alcohol dehydrogenase-like predicted oxidoreductase